MELPSTKVGVTLTIVVLIVAGTIVSTKFTKKENPIVDLKNIDLIIERKTQRDFKNGDSDKDGLADWLEEFYKSNPSIADTDGDGTSDGEEVSLDRDPTIAGPNDPLITRKDLLQTEADMSKYNAGSVTDKASIELFSKYLNLKKEGLLKPEDEAALVNDLSKKITEQASLVPKYSKTDLNIVNSTKESITAYGDRVAQASIGALTKMDSHKNLEDTEYFLALSEEYKDYAYELSQVSVPTVSQELHIELINYLYKTAILYENFVKADADPLSSLVIITQYKNSTTNDAQLYTALSQYFKNNDIIFDIESTKLSLIHI